MFFKFFILTGIEPKKEFPYSFSYYKDFQKYLQENKEEFPVLFSFLNPITFNRLPLLPLIVLESPEPISPEFTKLFLEFLNFILKKTKDQTEKKLRNEHNTFRELEHKRNPNFIGFIPPLHLPRITIKEIDIDNLLGFKKLGILEGEETEEIKKLIQEIEGNKN